MKGAVLCVLALSAVALARPEEAKYTNKYDSVNLEEILSNTKLLEGYKKCLLDTGKCTADAKELKSNMGDALATGCAKCTDAQKDGTELVTKHFITKDPETWEALKKKYDPTGKYAKQYEDRIKAVTA